MRCALLRRLSVADKPDQIGWTAEEGVLNEQFKEVAELQVPSSSAEKATLAAIV